MSRRAMQESLTIDLKHQLDANSIRKDLHDKALKVIHNFSADDWKDIDNMSTVEAVEMVLDVARHK